MVGGGVEGGPGQGVVEVVNRGMEEEEERGTIGHGACSQLARVQVRGGLKQKKRGRRR